MALKKKVIGFTVTVDGQPVGLALAKAGADIVAEGRSSLKGTRLFYDTTVTVFPTRKAARRAIARTVRSVAGIGPSLWTGKAYKVFPLVVLQ
jgi:hypothetical protein